jgi:hypothetical protein
LKTNALRRPRFNKFSEDVDIKDAKFQNLSVSWRTSLRRSLYLIHFEHNLGSGKDPAFGESSVGKDPPIGENLAVDGNSVIGDDRGIVILALCGDPAIGDYLAIGEDLAIADGPASGEEPGPVFKCLGLYSNAKIPVSKLSLDILAESHCSQ